MPQDPIREESRALIAAAKRISCFLERERIPGTRYTIRTGESEVRLVQNERMYYKIKNPFAKGHLKKHPAHYALYEHIVHNVLFPECPIEFSGITEDLHEARLVYRQRAVRSGERPDDAQISRWLADIGLEPAERYCFGNANLFVTDVGQDSDNVLWNPPNTLFFIDPIIGFREPLCRRLESMDFSESMIREFVYEVLALSSS